MFLNVNKLFKKQALEVAFLSLLSNCKISQIEYHRYLFQNNFFFFCFHNLKFKLLHAMRVKEYEVIQLFYIYFDILSLISILQEKTYTVFIGFVLGN